MLTVKVKKPLRREKTAIDVHQWNVGALTKSALSTIQSATLIEGDCIDTVLRVIINEDDIALFTPNIENRILAFMRNKFNKVVLIDFVTHEMEERRKAALLKQKLRREAERLEKEYKKRQALKGLSVN